MWQSRAISGYEELSKAIGRRRAQILARTQTVECGGREDLRFLSLSQNFRRMALYRAVDVRVARAHFDRGYECEDSELQLVSSASQ